ncbi:MAG: aldo/keto reductase [Clostridia bacterium]|nr:aldo/keto reductase [Clostridia bacterium]
MKTYANWGRPFSQMSLGTVQLGLDYGIANEDGKPSLEQSHEVLKTAIEGGVTALDTAATYGSSEKVLGSYFRAFGGRDSVFITTKFSLNMPGAPGAQARDAVRRSLERSLENLGMDRVDCLMLHRAEDFDEQGDAVLRALSDLKSEGMIGCAGISIYHPESLEKPLQSDVFSMVQAPMSLFDHALKDSGRMETLRQRGMALIIRSVFLQGLFFLDPDGISDPQLYGAAGEKLRMIRALADRENMTMAELAIAYIRDMPGVTSLVLGAEKPDQVRQNLGYFGGGAVLSAEGRRFIDENCAADIPQIMKALSARYNRGAEKEKAPKTR